MLYRKIQPYIESYLKSDSNKVLIIDGARQIGKTFIIRHVGQQLFENYIELNFAEDYNGPRLFEQVRTVKDFYFQVSTIAGERMGEKKNTLIFLDEIQAYPHLLTMLKFLKQDDRYTYIASGSLLGVTLKKTTSIPIGSIEIKRMFPLDFEEFLLANGFNRFAIDMMHEKFLTGESLDAAMHEKVMDLFKKYLLIGGLPDAVNSFIADTNIVKVRTIHRDIRAFYADDASKYEADNSRKLKIRRIYDMIPSNLESKKKRVVFQDIEDKRGKRFSDYQDEFEYLISAGIALDVNAITTSVFPLTQSIGKNLLKLYLNDVGLLTDVLYGSNIRAILDDETGINLGSVYESVVAQELVAHGFKLFYYDNRSKGEVDYLIDDYDSLSAVPIEVKSGKDYTVHSALNTFVKNDDYHVKKAYVLSNAREITTNGKITYLPIYDVMFLENVPTQQEMNNIIADLPKAYGKPQAFRFYRGGEYTDVDGKKKKAPDIQPVAREDLITAIKKCHNTLWGGGRLSPPTAFGELCKLIFVKISDEQKPRKKGEPYQFQIKTHEPSSKLAERINALYNEQKVKDPEVFTDSIKVDDRVLRTVVSHLESINLNKTDLDVKGVAFEQFMDGFFKGDFGQYFTPRPIIEFAVKMMKPEHDWDVLDPACGSGGFLLHALDYMRSQASEYYDKDTVDYFNYWHDFASKHLYGIEINDEIARVAKMNMIVHDDGHTNVISFDALDSIDKMHDHNRGFEAGKFDLILTNPPFGSTITKAEKPYLANYELGKTKDAKGKYYCRQQR